MIKKICLLIFLLAIFCSSALATTLVRSGNYSEGWISGFVEALNDTGLVVHPDSYVVLCIRDSSSANAVTYSAYCDDGNVSDSSWIDTAVVRGITYYYFKQQILTLAGGIAQPGGYHGKVICFADGQQFSNKFSFQIIDSTTALSVALNFLDALITSRLAPSGTLAHVTAIDTGGIARTSIMDGAISDAKVEDVIRVDVNTWKTGAIVAPALANYPGVNLLGINGQTTSPANLDEAFDADTTSAGLIGASRQVTNDIGITQVGADKVWGTTVRALTDKLGFSLTTAERGYIADTTWKRKLDQATYPPADSSAGADLRYNKSVLKDSLFKNSTDTLKYALNLINPATLTTTERGAIADSVLKSDSTSHSGTANTIGRNIFLGIGGGSSSNWSDAQRDSVLNAILDAGKLGNINTLVALLLDDSLGDAKAKINSYLDKAITGLDDNPWNNPKTDTASGMGDYIADRFADLDDDSSGGGGGGSTVTEFLDSTWRAGAYQCTLYAVDGSGNAIPNMLFTFRNSAGTPVRQHITDDNGRWIFGVDTITYYIYGELATYSQDNSPDTITITGTVRDTILFTEFTATIPADPRTVTLWLCFKDFGLDERSGAKLTCKLNNSGLVQYSDSSAYIDPSERTFVVASDGIAYVKVVRSSEMTPANLKYKITIPLKSGGSWTIDMLAPDQTTYRIRK